MDIFLASFLTLYITHICIVKLKFNTCLASSLVSLMAFSFIQLTPLDIELARVCFGASFVAMANGGRYKFNFIFLSSLIFSVIFYTFYNEIDFLGGSLGFSAFITCIIYYLISKSINFLTIVSKR